MLFRPFLATSLLSLGASAFLVVPSVPKPIEDAALSEEPGLRTLDRIGSQERGILLSCAECPFPEKTEDGQVNLVEGVENALILNVAVKDEFLHINNQRVFPPPENIPPLTVEQVRTSDRQVSDPVRMGLVMDVSPTMPPQDGNELLSIRFTVLQVDGRPVLVDTVVLDVIRTNTGELLIAKTEIEATAGDHRSWKQCGHNPGCLKELLFARIQSLLASARARFANFSSRLHFGKGCHKGKGAHAGSLSGHRKPEGHNHHHGHHGHHGHHRPRWCRTFLRAVRFIVVPALLGVMAGLAASAIGMLVGQLIVFLWLRYRRSTNKSRRSAPSTVERGTSFEKEGLMTSDAADELPPYSDEDAANAPPLTESK